MLREANYGKHIINSICTIWYPDGQMYMYEYIHECITKLFYLKMLTDNTLFAIKTVIYVTVRYRKLHINF